MHNIHQNTCSSPTCTNKQTNKLYSLKTQSYPQEWWRRVFLQGSGCSSPGAETSLWGAARVWEWGSSCSAVCWRTSWM